MAPLPSFCTHRCVNCGKGLYFNGAWHHSGGWQHCIPTYRRQSGVWDPADGSYPPDYPVTIGEVV